MKTQIKAELILASKNASTGDILYTLRLTYPRIILAEFLTHRVFSRNTSSSRAIPGKKMRQQVLSDPFIPVYIGAKQKGMQAGAELTGVRRWAVQKLWAAARYPAVLASYLLEKVGVAKQIANRVLEPWQWVTQVASATDLKNFIKLRTHKAAEPHFQDLAKQIEEIVNCAEGIFAYFEENDGGITGIFERCQILEPGQWHLPFTTEDDKLYAINSDAVVERRLISAARCARVSYTVIGDGGVPDLRKDYELGQKLIEADPIHASPIEHQAVALPTRSVRIGNFRSFNQWRYYFKDQAGGDA